MPLLGLGQVKLEEDTSAAKGTTWYVLNMNGNRLGSVIADTAFAKGRAWKAMDINNKQIGRVEKDPSYKDDKHWIVKQSGTQIGITSSWQEGIKKYWNHFMVTFTR